MVAPLRHDVEGYRIVGAEVAAGALGGAAITTADGFVNDGVHGLFATKPTRGSILMGVRLQR